MFYLLIISFVIALMTGLIEVEFNNTETNNSNCAEESINKDMIEADNNTIMTDAEWLATRLNERQYGSEVTTDLLKYAKDNNLVIAFGASDDLLELHGVYEDELGAYRGVTVYYDNKSEEFVNEAFVDTEKNKNYIKMNFSPTTIDATWSFETNIRNAHKFLIYEDDEIYGEGIVFSMSDVLS